MCENGAGVGLDVRGGGPASRESGVLNPVANAEKIHAVVLSGGSAFGLDAAGGVMQYLEEHDVGYYVGVAKVPIVCQSSLFDLSVGSASVRPDKAMGYAACENAEKHNYKDGNFGAGTGATVGKLHGLDYCMKSGIGSYAVQIGDLKLGAVVAVNAWGDVFDYKTGKQIAGLLGEDKKSLRQTADEMMKSYSVVENKFVSNTTIGIVITNAAFDKTKLTKIASMAHNGYSRSVNPVNTCADGDSIYAMSAGNITADLDMIGTLAAQVMSEAITRAVMSAESAYGLKAARFLNE
jgi:L-aminopeptidase/D-esterase-like protein